MYAKQKKTKLNENDIADMPEIIKEDLRDKSNFYSQNLMDLTLQEYKESVAFIKKNRGLSDEKFWKEIASEWTLNNQFKRLMRNFLSYSESEKNKDILHKIREAFKNCI